MRAPRETPTRPPREASPPRRRLLLAGSTASALAVLILGLTAALPGPAAPAAARNPEAGSAPPLQATLRDVAPPPRLAATPRRPAADPPEAALRAFAAPAGPRLGGSTASPAASLAEANAKLAAKVAKRQAKAEARIAKLQASIAAKQAASAQHAVDVVVDEQLVELIEGFLTLAEQDLAAAQALPEATPEQLASKLEAVAQAELGVKLATKEVASAQKAVAKHEKAMAKLAAQVAKQQAKQAEQEGLVDDAVAELALLAAPFDFDAGGSQTVGLLVTDGSAPLSDVEVVLASALSKPKGKGRVERDAARVYFRGRTGADGRVDASVRLPDHLEQLDVILDADGYSGDWTWDDHRERAGLFAPSQRVTVDVADLAARTFPLEDA